MWWCLTGNFGNILAAYFAKRMGLPVKTLVCASNDNKVLYDFLPQEFMTGKRVYPHQFTVHGYPYIQQPGAPHLHEYRM